MKIECPVCHQPVLLSQIRDVREFECPHCHFIIEMESFAASLLQLIPVAALIVFIVVYSVLSVFISDTVLVLVFLGMVLAESRFHTSCIVLRYLGLLKFHRKAENKKEL